ncbi:hypothetical protein [Aquibium microcysteis]|uniref:hypothetical protein n=1 Tax=Aquibium microcysteis TaxID=675281 RepID=UPI00165D060E|nr:hypothetical protein [Aquibium microcysteis]
MIIDCVLLNDEYEILNIRLSLLSSCVERHIVVASNETFTGRSKNINLSYVIDRIPEEYRHKVDVVWLEKLVGKDPWQREYYSRNSLVHYMEKCRDEDIILFSDVDEIPRPSALTAITQFGCSEISYLGLDTYNFKFNYKLIHGLDAVWAGPVVFPRRLLRSPQEMRSARWENVITGKNFIYNAGWHFSYLTRTNDVSTKLASYSHQEREAQMNKKADIAAFIRERRGFHSHVRPGEVWAVVSIDDFGCKELTSLVSRYPEFLSHEAIDSPDDINLAVRLSLNRLHRHERHKILPWFSGGEVISDISRRFLRKVLP